MNSVRVSTQLNSDFFCLNTVSYFLILNLLNCIQFEFSYFIKLNRFDYICIV